MPTNTQATSGTSWFRHGVWVLVAAVCVLIGFAATNSPSSAADAVSQVADVELVNKSEDRYVRVVEGQFDDVFDDVKFAISESNYRITGINSIGSGIAAREDNASYFAASVVHFCNLQAAKRILDISTDYLLHMPCRVSLFEAADGKIRVEARLLPLDDPRLYDVAVEVNAMLVNIVDFAAGDW